MIRCLLPILCLGLVAALAGCSSLVDASEYEPEIVVESYQIAGELLQPVRLQRTAPLDAPYVPEDLAVRDAAVMIRLLEADGTVAATYAYAPSETRPGVYLPIPSNTVAQPVVQPLRRYELVAEVPGAGTVRATTLVPGDFEVVRLNADAIVYQGPEQFEATVTRSAYPNREARFIFTTEALEPRIDNLTPVYADIFDEGEDDVEEFRQGRSPILNEANYEVNSDETISIRLPWLAVTFYGRNEVAIHAIDDNLFDYLRTLDVQQGGSTLGPGEIPDLIDHVENGRGVFGSYARVASQVEILRPQV